MNTGSEELLTTESRISVLCWCFYYDISVALKNQNAKVPTEIWESLSINISKQVVYLIWSENAKGKTFYCIIGAFGHWISDCLHFRVFSFPFLYSWTLRELKSVCKVFFAFIRSKGKYEHYDWSNNLKFYSKKIERVIITFFLIKYMLLKK